MCSWVQLYTLIEIYNVFFKQEAVMWKNTQNRFLGKLHNHYFGNWAIWKKYMYKSPGIVGDWNEIYTRFLLAYALSSILTNAKVWWGGQNWRDSMRNRLRRSADFCMCVLCVITLSGGLWWEGSGVAWLVYLLTFEKRVMKTNFSKQLFTGSSSKLWPEVLCSIKDPGKVWCEPVCGDL